MLRPISTFALVLCWLCPSAFGQCDAPIDLYAQLPAALSPEDHFGDAVATDGNWVVVGAPEYDGSLPN